MKRWIVSVFALLATAMVGCVTLPPEQVAYLEEMGRTPTEFVIPRAQEEDAWGRAQSFIGRHSSMKLDVATDYVLQTHNPPENGGIAYGYYIVKTPEGKSVRFDVECVVNNPYVQGRCRQNAGMLATYIKTGKLKYPQLVRK